MNNEDWYQDAINGLVKKHVAIVLDESLECTVAHGNSVAWLKDWLAGKAKLEYIPVRKAQP